MKEDIRMMQVLLCITASVRAETFRDYYRAETCSYTPLSFLSAGRALCSDWSDEALSKVFPGSMRIYSKPERAGAIAPYIVSEKGSYAEAIVPLVKFARIVADDESDSRGYGASNARLGMTVEGIKQAKAEGRLAKYISDKAFDFGRNYRAGMTETILFAAKGDYPEQKAYYTHRVLYSWEAFALAMNYALPYLFTVFEDSDPAKTFKRCEMIEAIRLYATGARSFYGTYRDAAELALAFRDSPERFFFGEPKREDIMPIAHWLASHLIYDFVGVSDDDAEIVEQAFYWP